jgi:diguanylate cyclase
VTKEFSSMKSADEPPLTEVFLTAVAQAMKVNERLQNRLSAAEERLQNQAQQIESHISEARTDALTGLPNRRAFDDELNRRVAEWQRKQTQFSLIMVDVDHFKALNDRCGHPAGDEILRQLAKVLRLTFREMDMVARFGGEEFAAILPSTSLNDGTRAAERVRKAVANFEFQLGQSIFQMTISVGLAAADADDDSASLVRKADEALYASKRAGRNCGYFHTGQTCRRIPATSPFQRGRWKDNVAAYAQDDAELQATCDDLRSSLGQLLDET